MLAASSIARGLRSITIGKDLTTNLIPLVISRPFHSIVDKSGTKNAVLRADIISTTEVFDRKQGPVFQDYTAVVKNYFHTTGKDPHNHLTVTVLDAHGGPTYWYQISDNDYWDVLHIHQNDTLIKENDYLPIMKDMMEVGRVYRLGEGKEDTYWFNAKAKKLVVWKNNEAVIPKALLTDFADWVKIDHATFNA